MLKLKDVLTTINILNINVDKIPWLKWLKYILDKNSISVQVAEELKILT